MQVRKPLTLALCLTSCLSLWFLFVVGSWRIVNRSHIFFRRPIPLPRLGFESYSTASCRVRVLRTEQEVFAEKLNSQGTG